MNGVTRAKVIEVCRRDGIPVFERSFSLVDACAAEEAFLTGTFGAKTPVSEIEGRSVGREGRQGPVLHLTRELCAALVQENTR